MSRPEVLVEVEGLVKRYGGLQAVAGIDFSIRRGEIVGLLGPNGAGKTTTIRMLLGLVRPTAGAVRIAGIPVERSDGSLQRMIGWGPSPPASTRCFLAASSCGCWRRSTACPTHTAVSKRPCGALG